MRKIFLLFVLFVFKSAAYSQQTFNSYVPQIPVDAYKEAEIAKQKQYNENTKRVAEAVNDANYYLDKLHNLNDSVYRQFAIPFNDYIKNLNNNRIDYAKYGDDIVNALRDFTEEVKKAIKNEY